MEAVTYRGPSAAALDRATEAAWRGNPAPTPDPTHDPGVVIHPVPTERDHQ